MDMDCREGQGGRGGAGGEGKALEWVRMRLLAARRAAGGPVGGWVGGWGLTNRWA